MQHTLNKDQTKASDEILKFLISNQKEHVLSGMAGTGKTFMLDYLQKTIYQKYARLSKLINDPLKIKSIVFTATTNKAAKVLNASNMGALTTHSFLNLIIYNDFNTGKDVVKPTKNWKVYSNVLLIIDEASMINNQLKQYIDSALDNTCKVLYVGDECQLPAVMSKNAVAFKSNFKQSNLNTLVRSKDNIDLQNLIIKLRDNVLNDKLISYEELSSELPVLNQTSFKDFIDNNFIDLKHKGSLLCYENNATIKFNNYLRNLRGLSGVPLPGEILTNNNLLKTKQSYVHGVNLFKPINSKIEILEFKGKSVDEYGINYNDYLVCLDNSLNTYISVPVNYNEVKELIKQETKIKNWRTVYALKEIPDLRYIDAQTVHKSQGSTYDWVVIDYNNILKCKQKNIINRLLYVAISRAKNNVYIYKSK